MFKITTRLPNVEEQATLQGATTWVNEILEKEFKTKVRLKGTWEDIPTLHTMLSEGPYTADVEAELISFSMVFGHVLARELGMGWVIYNDAEGCDYALQYQDFALFLFPCDMLIKRVEAGEEIGGINLEAMLEKLREALAEDLPNAAKHRN